MIFVHLDSLFGTFEGPDRFYQCFLPFFSPQRKIRPATVAVRRCAAELLVAAVDASTRCVFLRHAEKLGCKVVSETWHRFGEVKTPLMGPLVDGNCFWNVFLECWDIYVYLLEYEVMGIMGILGYGIFTGDIL